MADKPDPRLVTAMQEVLAALADPSPASGPGSANPFGSIGLSKDFLEAHPEESKISPEELAQVTAGLAKAGADIASYTRLVKLGRSLVDGVKDIIEGGASPV